RHPTNQLSEYLHPAQWGEKNCYCLCAASLQHRQYSNQSAQPFSAAKAQCVARLDLLAAKTHSSTQTQTLSNRLLCCSRSADGASLIIAIQALTQQALAQAAKPQS